MYKKFEALWTLKNCHIFVLVWLALNIVLRIPSDLAMWLIIGISYFVLTQKYGTLLYVAQTVMSILRKKENDVELKVDSKTTSNVNNKK